MGSLRGSVCAAVRGSCGCVAVGGPEPPGAPFWGACEVGHVLSGARHTAGRRCCRAFSETGLLVTKGPYGTEGFGIVPWRFSGAAFCPVVVGVSTAVVSGRCRD